MRGLRVAVEHEIEIGKRRDRVALRDPRALLAASIVRHGTASSSSFVRRISFFASAIAATSSNLTGAELGAFEQTSRRRATRLPLVAARIVRAEDASQLADRVVLVIDRRGNGGRCGCTGTDRCRQSDDRGRPGSCRRAVERLRQQGFRTVGAVLQRAFDAPVGVDEHGRRRTVRSVCLGDLIGLLKQHELEPVLLRVRAVELGVGLRDERHVDPPAVLPLPASELR